METVLGILLIPIAFAVWFAIRELIAHGIWRASSEMSERRAMKRYYRQLADQYRVKKS